MSNGSPPITSAPVPPSIAGIPQPVFASGSATSPATPISITGTPILPPPQVGFGGNAPATPQAIVPAPVPPSTAGFPQPQYASGSGTVPTAASLFPSFSAAGPSPPIIINAAQNTNTPIWVPPPALPLPTTPGIAAIIISTAPNIPQLPWSPGPAGTPVNTVLPAISGSTIVGSTLTATPGTWTNSPTSYAYQWLGNGAPISGANASTYVLQSTDLGTLISVRVTAINAAGVMNADSAAVGPVTATMALSQQTRHAPTTQHRSRK